MASLGRLIYANPVILGGLFPNGKCVGMRLPVLNRRFSNGSTIQKQTFKTFGIRMDSEFECSVFEPRLYFGY